MIPAGHDELDQAAYAFELRIRPLFILAANEMARVNPELGGSEYCLSDAETVCQSMNQLYIDWHDLREKIRAVIAQPKSTTEGVATHG